MFIAHSGRYSDVSLKHSYGWDYYSQTDELGAGPVSYGAERLLTTWVSVSWEEA